jgi:hypothetical protein
MNPLDNLKAKRQLLSGWIADHRERTEQLPHVQQSLDIVNYQLDVVSSMPPALPTTVQDDIVMGYSNSTPYWEQFAQAYPTRVTVLLAISGLALEASGSNVAYQAISAATIGYTPEVHDWARGKTVEYQAIQQQHNRAGQVRDSISRVVPHRLTEFDSAESSFAFALGRSQPQSVWGIHARNLLEHVKGDFFVAAQKAQKKQKVKWSEFADALARGGVGSAEHKGLIAEEATHRRLHDAFTDIAKNLIQVPEADLRDRQSEFHEHLFSLFSFVDEPTFRTNAQQSACT